MRRFEFTQGTSSKFWEIAVTGSSVTTWWGRIGTDGQTKTKELGTPAAATKEADKQIKAKSKKGYVEVEAGAAKAVTPPKAPPAPKVPPAPKAASPAPEASIPKTAAPSPASAPSAEPVELPDEDTFVLPSSWKARLHPRRDDTFIPEDSHNAGKSWAAFRKAVGAQYAPLVDRLDPATLTEEDAVSLLTQTRHSRSYWNDTITPHLVRALLATRPVAFVAGVVMSYRPDRTHRISGIVGYHLVRRALASCSAEEHAAAHARVVSFRAADLAAGEVRYLGLAAYWFPEEDSWRTPALTGATADPLLLCCPDNWSDVEALNANMWGMPTGIFETLLARFGEDAVAFVSGRLTAQDADLRKTVGRVLAECPWDVAMAALFDHIDDRNVLPFVQRAVERFPVRMIRMGLERAVSKTSLRPHVSSWLYGRSEAVSVARGQASDKALALLESLQADAAPTYPAAALESLHPIFTNPPWTRKAPRRQALEITPDLAPLEVSRTADEDEIVRGIREAVDSAPTLSSLLGSRWYGLDHRILLASVLTALGDTQTSAADTGSRLVEYTLSEHRVAAVLAAFDMLEPERAVAAVESVCRTADESVYAAIACPMTAQLAFEHLSSKSRRGLALAWVERHPDYAARAWLPIALGRAGKAQRSATEHLARMAYLGHGDSIRRAGEHYGVSDAAEALLNADPLLGFTIKPPKTITFWNPAALPDLKLAHRDEALPPQAVEVAVRILAMSPLDVPYAGAAVLQQELDANSLANFAWALFEQWEIGGSPSKEGWALTALGVVGNDDIAMRLTPRIRAWPGQSQHKRAVNGLDVLLGIGTDVAMMQLNGVAQKVKFKGIKHQARERMAALAEKLGLTSAQLADRLVPDLGLDANGSLVLDYGPRQFTVGFNEALKPFVKDAAGKRRANLPKPGVKDDDTLAPAAFEQFKLLKKAVRTLSKIELQRLEWAMVTGRRWSQSDFEEFLVGHPLLIHLVSRVVWGVYGDDGLLLTSFRVDEGGGTVDAEDETLALPAGQVGVLHPIDAEASVLGVWGDVFADYDLIQPFVQLGRPIHRLPPEEMASGKLVRNPNQEIPVTQVVGLQSKGWERGEAQDAGVVHSMALPLADGVYEVRLNLGGGGIWTSMISEQSDDPTIESVVICKRGAWNSDGDLAFSTLSPGLVSEVLDVLERLQG